MVAAVKFCCAPSRGLGPLGVGQLRLKPSRFQQRGVALVEFALSLPLLLVVSLLVTEMGRAVYQYNTLTKSVRDAARYLSVQDPSIASTDPARLQVARNLVVYGVPAPPDGSPPLAQGLNLSHVPASNIRWSLQGSEPLINTVTVTISGYGFRPLLASVFGLRFADDAGLIAYGPISASMRAPL